MRWMLTLGAVSVLFAAAPEAAHGCSGRRVETKLFHSESKEYSLEVDPRWDGAFQEWSPLLTLRRGETVLWSREASAFQGFRFPLDVSLSDDGRWLVFGGASVHNISFDAKYEEGLRFYRADGTLIRFVSRRDLPVGGYGISTSFWYDEWSSRIVGKEFHFYTPGREEALVFDVTTGALVHGELTPGQGDDSHHEGWLRERIRRAG